MKNVMIIVLVIALGFIADRAVRAENQRYALLLGMCIDGDPGRPPNFDCLDEVQTRTSWIWHLYYLVVEPAPSVPL